MIKYGKVEMLYQKWVEVYFFVLFLCRKCRKKYFRVSLHFVFLIRYVVLDKEYWEEKSKMKTIIVAENKVKVEKQMTVEECISFYGGAIKRWANEYPSFLFARFA